MINNRIENPCVAGSIPALPNTPSTSEHTRNTAQNGGVSSCAKTDPQRPETPDTALTESGAHCGRIVGKQVWRFSRPPALTPNEHEGDTGFEIEIGWDSQPRITFNGSRWWCGPLVKRSEVARRLGRGEEYVMGMEDVVNRLQDALVTYDTRPPRVPQPPAKLAGVPDLESFDEFEPPVGYVYFLMDGEEVVYVGQTCDLKNRIGRHRKDKAFTGVYFVRVRVDRLLERERHYIRKFNPRYNRD